MFKAKKSKGTRQFTALAGLLCGCNIWPAYVRHWKQLERFHMRSVGSILNIRWQDRITKLEVMERAESTSIGATMLKAKLR